jgi:hypothetical protein
LLQLGGQQREQRVIVRAFHDHCFCQCHRGNRRPDERSAEKKNSWRS